MRPTKGHKTFPTLELKPPHSLCPYSLCKTYCIISSFNAQIGAKFTGTDIAPDDYSQVELDLGFEAKRDRWNGYDASEHKRLFEEHQRLEEARKLAKAKQIEEKLAKADESTSGQVCSVVAQIQFTLVYF